MLGRALKGDYSGTLNKNQKYDEHVNKCMTDIDLLRQDRCRRRMLTLLITYWSYCG